MNGDFRNLNVPINYLYCEECRREVVPSYQLRLRAEECRQTTDCIYWWCPICWGEKGTRDDVSILDAEVIDDENS